MTEIKFKDKELYVCDKIISFTEKIEQIKQDKNKVFVLLDIPEKEELLYDDFHNVYCYSFEGEKIWQIGIRPLGDKVIYTMINLDGPFLYANDFMGRKFTVDKNTGEIKDMMITK